jgi:hypothetical protein
MRIQLFAFYHRTTMRKITSGTEMVPFVIFDLNAALKIETASLGG